MNIINTLREYKNKIYLKKRIRLLNKNKNKMLFLLRGYLSNHEISYWLEYGSLLGAIREKKIISHDYDIDIGLLQSEWNINIRKQLKLINFDLVREIKIDGIVYEESYQYNQILVDFFYCPLKENIISIPVFRPFAGLTWEQSLQEKKGLELYLFHQEFKGLKETEFENYNFSIPVNYHEHLLNYYGLDYMVPDENWNRENEAKATGRKGIQVTYK